MRGGPVRSSLHTPLSTAINTSTPMRRVDKAVVPPPPPPVPPKEKGDTAGQTKTPTGDVANVLGGAGSRRTVYLVDENHIKADQSPSSSISQPSSKAAAAVASPAISTSNDSSAGGGGGPTTLLMYNRISNIIAPLSEEDNGGGGEKFGTSNQNKSLEEKEKESAIWYEYGCV